MDSTAVTSKGQVTIPHDVRRRLGIRQGSRVAFKLRGDHAELRIIHRPAEVEGDGFGLLKSAKKAVPADFDAASLLGRRSKK